MNCRTEKQNKIQQFTRMHPGNKKLHIDIYIGSKSEIGYAEINVIVHKYRCYVQATVQQEVKPY
jgi:hypothetical protein